MIHPLSYTPGKLEILDQRRLPESIEYIQCNQWQTAVDCIQNMSVRGAPAIAFTGLYSLLLYIHHCPEKISGFELYQVIQTISNSRPTAVHLSLLLHEFKDKHIPKMNTEYLKSELIWELEQAINIELKKDLDHNLSITKHALSHIKTGSSCNIITHCNTGILATAGHGTALGVIRGFQASGRQPTVFVQETRPYQQGSRLTMWELMQENINCYLLSEGMSSWLCGTKKIDFAIVGADRIASNGDTANKIGTYTLAVVCKHFGIPFYVAATYNSIDFTKKNGKEIPIEMRPEIELTQNFFLKDRAGRQYIPEGVLSPRNSRAVNPSFDVTPYELISGIFTEKGPYLP